MSADRIEAVVGLCSRRGFTYPCGEIYGGTRQAWDYGPLGVELKNNLVRAWWKAVVQGRDDVAGLDSSVILPRDVLSASGHLDAFGDRLVECTADAGAHYLRPETAQGAFVNFLNVLTTSRRKPPFGIGQIGKSFRKETSSTGAFLFRTSEFEQMELEFFVEPGTDDEWHQYWINERLAWYTGLGIDKNSLRINENPGDTRAHYAKRTVDIEYRYSFPDQEWGELESVANRADYDLTAHSNHSGVDLSYFDRATSSRYRPFVIEPAAGVGRALMAFLLDGYLEEEAPNAIGGTDKRIVLRLDPRLAPVKVAVLPEARSVDLTPTGRSLAAALRRHWTVDFDDAGSIGRRYRRQDEIGTPFCVTLAFDSIGDHAVLVRERDSTAQAMVSLDQLEPYLAARLIGC